jgi:hypothetical protein
MLVDETAAALAALDDDPQGLVTACRRIVDHQSASGPAWWLCSKVLASPDPSNEAWRCAYELSEDDTLGQLIDALPEESSIVALGLGEVTAAACARRGDVQVAASDDQLVRQLSRSGAEVEAYDLGALCVLAAEADVVVIEAAAASPDGLLCPLGTLGPAAVAALYRRPVWLVAPTGRILPAPTFTALIDRVGDDIGAGGTWEIVPASLVTTAIGPTGPVDIDELLRAAAVPVTPELFVRTVI